MAYFGDSKFPVPPEAYYGQQAVTSSAAAPSRNTSAVVATAKRRKYFEDQEGTATSTKKVRREPAKATPTSTSTATAMARVIANPDLYRQIMERAETPYCSQATNGGERCARAWIYRNMAPVSDQKGSRFAALPPRELNCSQYCGDRCEGWLAVALHSPPEHVYIWHDNQLLGKQEIPRWSLRLTSRRGYVFVGMEFRSYDGKINDQPQWQIDGQAGEWDKKSLNGGQRIISAVNLAKLICDELRQHAGSLKLLTGW